MTKDKITSIFEMVWKYGIGFTLLLMGGVFMIVASKAGAGLGDYPEFMNIGISIMSFGIVAYSIDEIIDFHKMRIENTAKIRLARIKKGGEPPTIKEKVNIAREKKKKGNK